MKKSILPLIIILALFWACPTPKPMPTPITPTTGGSSTHPVTPAPVVPVWPAKLKYPAYAFVPELLEANGDTAAYLKKIRNAGAWGIRFFLLQSWSTSRLVPWMQAQYNGTSVTIQIPSEKLKTPVTDLSQSNSAYWTRLNEVLALLKADDLEAVVSLGDNCSQNTHTQLLSYPFFASLNTMSQQETWPYVVPQAALKVCHASTGGLYGPIKYPLFQAWIKSAVDALKASGVTYRIEIQNEFEKNGWTDSTPENWWKMCYTAAQADGATLFLNSGDYSIISKYAGVYSLHGVGKATFQTISGMKSATTLLSGDGAQGNSTTDIDVMGRHGLSVADAQTLAARIAKEGWWGIELMNKATWSRDDSLADLDDATFEIWDALKAIWN